MKKEIIVLSFLILTLFSAFSQTQKKSEQKEEPQIVFNEDFEQGKELFGLNRPEEAIASFEKILEEKNIDPAIYIYLGVAYYQVGQFPKSYSICTKGLALAGTDHKVLAFNAGNSAYAMGNYARANACYAIAIKEAPDFAPSYLNRANSQLKQDYLQDARENYEKYLSLEPDGEQSEKIRHLLDLLAAEIERRANQKPEIIDPDDFVENQKMEVPPVIEKVDFELPQEITEDVPVEDELIIEDAVAPALPEEELSEEKSEIVEKEILPPETENTVVETVETIDSGEIVVREVLPPENQDEVVVQDVGEVVEPQILPDIEEPHIEEMIESVDEEDKKAPGFSDAK